MEEKLLIFKDLTELFKENGFSIYLVGGTVRDYLLKKTLTDMDAVTDATPLEMEKFLPDADFTFKKMGSIRLKYKNVKFDITTLRKEENYNDSRHPNNIVFVKDLKEDVVRRDFTINGMYMDADLHVYDYVEGKKSLQKRIIFMIGDPLTRINEDPLRILRALRFAIDFDFDIDEKLSDVIRSNISLLKKLNPQKIKEEIKKIKSDEVKKNEIFIKFGIADILNVIE